MSNSEALKREGAVTEALKRSAGFETATALASLEASQRSAQFEAFKRSADEAWNRSATHISLVGGEELSFAPLDKFSLLQSSAPGGSRLLRDDAALLSYVTLAFFTHAQQAERAGADPDSVIRRLLDAGLWERWLTLHEDYALDTTLLYVAAHHRLKSWVRMILQPRSSMDSSTGMPDKWLLRRIFSQNMPAVFQILSRREGHGFSLLAEVSGNEFFESNQDTRQLLQTLVTQYSTSCMRTYLWAGKGFWRAEQDQEPFLLDAALTLDHGETALHLAASRGKSTMVTMLICRGADVSVTDCNNRTALHHACCHSQPVSSQMAPIDEDAAQRARARYEIAKTLIDSGIPADYPDIEGNTALHLLCSASSLPRFGLTSEGEHSFLTTLGLLTSHGADLEARNYAGATPLHLACGLDLTELDPDPETTRMIVGELLRAGANPSAVTLNNTTPLHTAAACCYPDTIRELIESNARIMDRQTDGRVPLHYAARAGNEKAASYLLARGHQDINITDYKGWTPLQDVCETFRTSTTSQELFVCMACRSLIETLLRQGATAFNKRNLDGLTAADIVKDHGLWELLSERAIDSPWKQAGSEDTPGL